MTVIFLLITDEELMTGDFVKVKVTGTNDCDLDWRIGFVKFRRLYEFTE